MIDRAHPLLLAAALAALLTACGGGDDAPAPAAPAATVQLTGTAATGAAIAGATVTAVNAAGRSATAVTAADGSFTVTVADGAPYALTVTDAAGKAWYSYAPAAGTANLTPLTTLALAQAGAGRPLDTLFQQWASAHLDAGVVLEAAKTVNANLQALMQSKGVDFAKANVFADRFAADGSGLDAVLDAMRVSFSCSAGACTEQITTPQGATLVTWNGNILTTGINVSWSGGAAGGGSGGSVTVGLGSCKAPVKGTYSLVVSTAVSGLAVSVPEVCIDGLPDKPAGQGDFCSAAQVQQQLPPGVSVLACSYAGNQGSVSARISQPVTIDYTVTYTYVLN